MPTEDWRSTLIAPRIFRNSNTRGKRSSSKDDSIHWRERQSFRCFFNRDEKPFFWQTTRLKLVDFRIKCTTKREEKYQKFKEERLEKKSAKLFDLIPKLEMENGSKQEKKRKIDVNKLTVEFMHQVDIARTRNYDLRELLWHELISTSLHLTKDRLLRKSPKSELAQVLKHHVSAIPTEGPSVGEMQSALVIDFMTYCRKVTIKKLCLNTYADFSKHLLSTFQNIFQTSQRIDIVFDLYLDQSFKQGERNRRKNEDCIGITIKSANQILPIKMDKFWGSSNWNTSLFHGFWKIKKVPDQSSWVVLTEMTSHLPSWYQMELPAHNNFWNVTMKKQTNRCCFM